MKDDSLDRRLKEAFRREQINGLRLALTGRVVVLLVFGAFAIATRPAPLVYYTLLVVALFTLLGVAQLRLVGSRWDRPWVMPAFLFVDVLLLTVIIVGFSGGTIADLPRTVVYRFDHVLFFFVFVAAAAFSYSPAYVLWSGVVSGLVWLGGAFWLKWTTETLEYADIVRPATRERFLSVVLDPNFLGIVSRIQEAIIVASVAALLALVVFRARRVVYRQARAEQEREMVSEMFGRYVPKAVAQALIADRGALAPEIRTATVLFADIEEFTTIAESMPPQDVVDMLNAYFDCVAEVIGRHGGVINQFQGDAVLATFNVPLADADHAGAAVRSASEIQDAVRGREFAGHPLNTRIGINTGEMVAGSVGASGRQNYTVHGDAVNLAARLEALNKTYGTRTLVSESTVALVGLEDGFTRVGTLKVRGRSKPVTLYTLSPPAMV